MTVIKDTILGFVVADALGVPVEFESREYLKKHKITEMEEYMSYMETVAYKLAHYFGFILADQFLYHVIPGYVNDSVTQMQYAWDLQKYLQLDLKVLE